MTPHNTRDDRTPQLAGPRIIRPGWVDRPFRERPELGTAPEIVERLRGTPVRVRERIGHLPRARVVFRDGRTWTIQENVGHLGDLEPLWLRRHEEILVGTEQMCPADLGNRATWNAGHNCALLPTLLERFESRRQMWVTRLDTLRAEHFAKRSMHPRLGRPMRLIDLCHFVAAHDDYHLARITELIALSDVPARIERYRDIWQGEFERLNRQWIEKHFALESTDIRQFRHPRRHFIARGGEIFFVVLGERVLGTCALARHSAGEYEIAKMAVDPDARGQGFGGMLMRAAIDHAMARGAERIRILTDSKLPAAVRLYERFGFRRTDRVRNARYERGDIELMLHLAPSHTPLWVIEGCGEGMSA